jgi:hypothetical protein
MGDDQPGEGELEAGERLLAAALGGGRVVIGAAIWLAPSRAAQALGFGTIDSKALALGRVAATRDLVLGAGQLGSLARPAELRRATLAAALSDAGDTVAFALAIRAGAETRRAGLRGIVFAAPAAVAGGWLAARLRHRQGGRGS